MQRLTDLFEGRWSLAAVALVAGIGLGLLFGWVIYPVQWVDASAEHLRADLRSSYLRMAIESYAASDDAETLLSRYQDLGRYADEALTAIGADPQTIDPTVIQSVNALVELVGGGDQAPGATPPPALPGENSGGSSLGQTALRWAFPVFGVTLLLGLIFFGALYLRSRTPEETEVFSLDRSSTPPAYDAMPVEETEAYDDEPLATFRTTYSLGSDHYDDSFSVESPSGDFLGECGVGIGDLIGKGDPKKISAFEIWLFDKNDIQTVTKVLMSRYVYQDSETRIRLSAKGDPVLAQPGALMVLETASLEVEARIVDMTYGEGALPGESFFERLTIELRAFARQSSLS